MSSPRAPAAGFEDARKVVCALAKVVGADTTRYTYDQLGNLTRVDLPDGSVVEYVIDGRNRRVERKVDGALTHGWIYQDQLSPVGELDSAGNAVTRYVYGTRAHVPDYMVRGGTTYRIVSDRLGSVRLVKGGAATSSRS